MARKPPTQLRAIDLTDAHGAALLSGLTRSRIHQYAEEGRIKTYFFQDGELVEAEGEERRGQIALFNRYEVAQLRTPNEHPRKGGRPRKTSFSSSEKIR